MRALGVEVGVEHASAQELRRRWPADAPGARPIGTSLAADGTAALTIVRHPDGAYLLDTPGHGTHRVSPDGRSVLSALPDGGGERLLYAQALPLAAVLQGVPCLHAGAVVVDGRALAVIGGAGAGKSTLVAALLEDGGTFLTDDVLALEGREPGVVAHPGPRFATLGADRHALLGPVASAALGPSVGDEGKLHFHPRGADGPVPLGVIVQLDRGEHEALRTVALARPTALLLAAAFVSYVDDPPVLAALLDVCAAVAAEVPVVRLEAPSAATPAEVAASARSVVR